MSDTFEKGLAIFADVYGPDMAEACRKGAASGDDFTALHIKWSLELPFGQVWTREEQLSRRDRSLAVLGMMGRAGWSMRVGLPALAANRASSPDANPPSRPSLRREGLSNR